MSNYSFISLATKPLAKLCYSFHPAVSTTKPLLVVFLNGMGMPQASWSTVIAGLKERPLSKGVPAMLTYDRYGQGQTTDRDPGDAGAADPMHGHDCLTVVHDLRQLLSQIITEKMGESEVDNVQLVFVANSIGGALSRLYAQEHPGTVAGLLLLDSVLANSDFVSIFPDPDAPNVDVDSLPAGVTVEALRAARTYTQRTFHPSNGSREGLSRKNLSQLLPDSDGPKIQGPDGRGPWVTVVGHEFESFESESERMGGISPLLTRVYTNPYWNRYNEGLTRITEPERSKGPLKAPGAGHFVQKDNPEFVENELREMLENII